MFPKIANKKFFWGSVGYFSFFVFIFSFSTLYNIDTLTITEWYCKFFMIFFKIAIILVIHFIVEKFFSYSLWIEKQFALDFPQQIDKISSICFVILLFLSTIPLIIAFFFSDNFYDIVFIKYFGIAFNAEKLLSYTGTSIGVFTTMLALHWATASTIYSTQYNHEVKDIQVLYFKLTKTTFLSILTCCYLVGVIFIYFYLSIENTTENVSIFKFIFNAHSYHSEKSISLLALIVVGFSSLLLVYFIRNSINFIKLSNNYYLYKFIAINTIFLFKEINVIGNSNYSKKLGQLIYNINILNKKIQNNIIHSKIVDSIFLDIINDYLDLIKEYWKIKKNIFYNTDWYPSLKRQNNLTEVILSGNNAEPARDILHIERWLFENNMLIINHLIANKSFALLNIYYDRIREILSLEEKENLLSYNVPFFYEILNFLRLEIEKNFIKILNNNILVTNKNDINYYGVVANLDYVLGNIFMNCQAFIFKFTNEEIDKIYPNFEDIKTAKTIQELCLKYPLINNEKGVKTYIKLFVEKNTEGQIITPKNNFTRECKIPLIKMELYNMLSSIQSVENILQKNLEYFVINEMPHHFFDTFYTFLQIKLEILINTEQYVIIYKNYFNNEDTITSKMQKFFSYQETIPNKLSLIIKCYRDNNYFSQREFPNLLNNIYVLLINLLILYFNIDNKLFKNELKTTIKLVFHLLMLQQDIVTKENNYNPNENHQKTIDNIINYPFVIFMGIIGAGLQKGNESKSNIKEIFREKFLKDEIKKYLNIFSSSCVTNDTFKLFDSAINQLENSLQVNNSITTFINFIKNFYNENNNDK